MNSRIIEQLRRAFLLRWFWQPTGLIDVLTCDELAKEIGHDEI